MAGDEMRVQYPGVFAAVRVNTIQIEPDLVRYIIHWLGDYIELKRQPGQPGVPEFVVAAQTALAEAHGASSDSRQREQDCLDGAEIVISGHEDTYVGTADAAAALECTADNVRQHCRNGNLKSCKVGRQVMVTTASIEDYKRRRAERSA